MHKKDYARPQPKTTQQQLSKVSSKSTKTIYQAVCFSSSFFIKYFLNGFV